LNRWLGRLPWQALGWRFLLNVLNLLLNERCHVQYRTGYACRGVDGTGKRLGVEDGIGRPAGTFNEVHFGASFRSGARRSAVSGGRQPSVSGLRMESPPYRTRVAGQGQGVHEMGGRSTVSARNQRKETSHRVAAAIRHAR
jgi:hypothetical protein